MTLPYPNLLLQMVYEPSISPCKTKIVIIDDSCYINMLNAEGQLHYKTVNIPFVSYGHFYLKNILRTDKCVICIAG
jgi:hypothetical protein